MTSHRSVQALTKCLEGQVGLGKLNSSTVASYKTAINKVLDVLDDDESEDVTGIDIEDVMDRFRHAHGPQYQKITIDSYEARLRASLAIFEDCLKIAGMRVEDEANDVNAHTIALPIPIRPNLIVLIQYLPHDLSTAEAKKIANVVLAMATG